MSLPVNVKDLFYQVQALLKANAESRGNAGGRVDNAKNLFTHIAECGLCGSPMHFIDKGKSPKGGYTFTATSLEAEGMPRKGSPIRGIRKLFFDNFEELDLSD